MRRKARIFLIYFPVILVAGQVLVNLLSFVAPSWYRATGFYLNTFFGTNVMFAVFLVIFTVLFNFCKVSRVAAIAECLFALNFMIVKQDNLYNILFQVIIGTLALIYTFWHYINKFPFCRVSLVLRFINSVIKKGSCSKGLKHWDSRMEKLLLNRHSENRS